jgi:hypothetical protein
LVSVTRFATSFRLDSGGPDGASFVIYNGGSHSCPEGTQLGTVRVGDQSGTVFRVDKEAYAICIRQSGVSWEFEGNRVSEDEFMNLMKGVVEVPA